MAFFIGLVLFYLLAWLISLFAFTDVLTGCMRGIVATAIMFTLVGISHFAKREKVEALIPPNWPFRRAANYLSGLAEIVLGIGLLFPETRTLCAWLLITLLIIIFPANIYVAVKKSNTYNITRLFFQPVYIFWIWWFCLKP